MTRGPGDTGHFYEGIQVRENRELVAVKSDALLRADRIVAALFAVTRVHRRKNMDRTRIENTLREIISEQLIVEEDQILLESRIVEDLQADSLDLVEILMVVEHQLDVTIDDDTWLGLKTFKEFADYLSTVIK